MLLGSDDCWCFLIDDKKSTMTSDDLIQVATPKFSLKEASDGAFQFLGRSKLTAVAIAVSWKGKEKFNPIRVLL